LKANRAFDFWLPYLSTRRSKSVSEIILCFFRYNQKRKILEKGEKPGQFAPNRAITHKDCECSLNPKEEYSNPIKVGFEFVQYLKDHPDSTYDDLSKMSGIGKARV